MLYMVIDELVAEAEGHGDERLATLAATGGFGLLLALDNALGRRAPAGVRQFPERAAAAWRMMACARPCPT